MDVKGIIIEQSKSNIDFWTKEIARMQTLAYIAVGFERTVLPINVDENDYVVASLHHGHDSLYIGVSIYCPYNRLVMAHHQTQMEAEGWILTKHRDEREITDNSDPSREYTSPDGDVVTITYSDIYSGSACHRQVIGYTHVLQPVYEWVCPDTVQEQSSHE